MDKILIQMPSDPREFFLFMPAIQDYIYQFVQEAERGLRDPYYQMTFRMNDDYEQFEAPLKVSKNNMPVFDYTGWSATPRSEFDCFIQADFPAATIISQRTGKHITESLGILIGSNPRKWPILPPPRCTEGKGIIVMCWGGDEDKKVKQLIGSDATLYDYAKPFTMKDVEALEIDTCEGFIGPASVFTHLAASYNRAVVEIFSDKASYDLYNNEGITNYQAILGMPVADQVLQAWEGLQCQIDSGSATRWGELEIPMEQPACSVENVEEKS